MTMMMMMIWKWNVCGTSKSWRRNQLSLPHCAGTEK